MDEFYKILKKRQSKYDEAIDKLIHGNDPNKNSKIMSLQIKNAELTSIIWTMEALMEEF